MRFYAVYSAELSCKSICTILSDETVLERTPRDLYPSRLRQTLKVFFDCTVKGRLFDN